MADESSGIISDSPAEAELNFTGMDKVTGVYADAFMLARKEDAVSLYFFQIGLPESRSGVLGEKTQLQAQEARCIGRIIMSPLGMSKLFQGMATNFDLSAVDDEKK